MLTNLLWFFVQYILVSCITYWTWCIYLLVHSYSSRWFICIHSIIVVWYITLTCYIYITHSFIIEFYILIEVSLNFVLINFNPLFSFRPVCLICCIYIMIDVLVKFACKLQVILITIARLFKWVLVLLQPSVFRTHLLYFRSLYVCILHLLVLANLNLLLFMSRIFQGVKTIHTNHVRSQGSQLLVYGSLLTLLY